MEVNALVIATGEEIEASLEVIGGHTDDVDLLVPHKLDGVRFAAPCHFVDVVAVYSEPAAIRRAEAQKVEAFAIQSLFAKLESAIQGIIHHSSATFLTSHDVRESDATALSIA